MSNDKSYANILVNKVTLDTIDFNPKDAVTKEYVDNQINALVSNAPDLLDTLGEIAEFLGPSSENDMSTTIFNRITTNESIIQEVSNSLVTEIDLHDEKIATLESTLSVETKTRESDIYDIVQNLSNEIVIRNAEISTLRSEMNNLVTTVIEQQNEITFLQLNNKLDKSSGYFKRSDGDFSISDNHYLYMGNDWRINSTNVSGMKRLQFEYSNDDGNTWSIGVPFIRSGIC